MMLLTVWELRILPSIHQAMEDSQIPEMDYSVFSNNAADNYFIQL